MNPQRRMTQSTLALLGLTALLAWLGLGAPHAQAQRRGSMEQANKAVVRRFYEEIFNNGNLAAVDELARALAGGLSRLECLLRLVLS